MIGTMPRPTESPTSKPRARAPSRKARAFSCNWVIRQLSSRMMRRLTSEAAARAGAMPTE